MPEPLTPARSLLPGRTCAFWPDFGTLLRLRNGPLEGTSTGLLGEVSG